MRRRKFIAGIGTASVLAPIAVWAQEVARSRHLALMVGGAETDPEMKLRVRVLVDSLQQLGWVAGTNLKIDYWFPPSSDPVATLAAGKELVARSPELIVASGST